MASTTFTTRCPGDGVERSRAAIAAGFRTVVAVGGDGTVHEVVNGIHIAGGLPEIRLGVVPAGTGMDFARNLRVPRKVNLLAKMLAGGSDLAIDVGRSSGHTDRLFLNFAEVGLGATVVKREAAFGDHWPGRMSFFIAAAMAAVQEEPARVTVWSGDHLVYRGPAVSVVVANGPYFGGGMKVAPQASIRDGKLDVLVLGDFTKVELMTQIWKIYPGIHARHRKVIGARVSRVRIESTKQRPLDLDGELIDDATYRFTAWPRALRVLTAAW